MNTLRFNGSLWCNLDIALRHLNQVYSQVTKPLGITVAEWYILRLLCDQDGQHPSQLAAAVGRTPTSFTPILDRLERKDLIKRAPDPKSRRALYIYLTDRGQAVRKQIRASAREIDTRVEQTVAKPDWEVFQRVLLQLQTLTLEAD